MRPGLNETRRSLKCSADHSMRLRGARKSQVIPVACCVSLNTSRGTAWPPREFQIASVQRSTRHGTAAELEGLSEIVVGVLLGGALSGHLDRAARAVSHHQP